MVPTPGLPRVTAGRVRFTQTYGVSGRANIAARSYRYCRSSENKCYPRFHAVSTTSKANVFGHAAHTIF